MPPEYRDRVASLGREVAGYAVRNPAQAGAPSVDRALQARKDLNAMGLRYAGRGVNVGAKTWDGRTALDISRANGNTQLADLLARSLPPER